MFRGPEREVLYLWFGDREGCFLIVRMGSLPNHAVKGGPDGILWLHLRHMPRLKAGAKEIVAAFCRLS